VKFYEIKKSQIARLLLLHRVGRAQRLLIQCILDINALQANNGFLNCAALLAIPVRLLDHLHLAVKEDLLLLFLDEERWLDDRFVVGSALALRLLRSFFIGGLRVRLTVEDHLLPRAVGLEDIEHFSEEWVLALTAARLHKTAVLLAIVAE